MSKFLNMNDDPSGPNPLISSTSKLGGGLKKRSKVPRKQADKSAVAKAGQAHGFTRATEPAAAQNAPRRGRPPLNEDMTYWRIYVSPDLRDDLNALRDAEGRRLNDVLRDAVAAYKAQSASES